MEIETIVIVVIVVFIFWWMFSGISEKVKEVTLLRNESVNGSVNESSLAENNKSNETFEINKSIDQGENLSTVLNATELENQKEINKIPQAVVVQPNGNELISQNAEIIKGEDNGVIHTATGKVVPIAILNDESNIQVAKNKSKKIQMKEIKRKIKKLSHTLVNDFDSQNSTSTFSDSLIATDSSKSSETKSMIVSGIPVALNIFENHASANHKIENSKRRRNN